MPCFHIAVPDLTSGHYRLFSTCKRTRGWLRLVFILGNRKKSARVLSGEQGGLLVPITFEFTRYNFIFESLHGTELALISSFLNPYEESVFCLMCSWSSISFRVMQWSLARISQTFATVSRFRHFTDAQSLDHHYLASQCESLKPCWDRHMRQNFISINTIKHIVCLCSCIPEFETDVNFHLYRCMTTRMNAACEWGCSW
jgi:hypothetical protein